MKVRCSPGYFLIFWAQFVLVCSDVDSFLFLLFCHLISCLLSSWPVCAASCVLLWLVRSRPRSVGFVSMVHLVSSIRSRLLWHYSQAIHLLWFGRSLHPSHEAVLPPSPRLAGCLPRMRRGQSALGRPRPVSILVETSGRCCRVSRLICQRVCLAPPGGSPGGARRVSCVGGHS